MVLLRGTLSTAQLMPVSLALSSKMGFLSPLDYQTVTLQGCWLAPGAPGEVLFSWRELWCVTLCLGG